MELADHAAVIANTAAGLHRTDGRMEHMPLSDLLHTDDELRAGRRMEILIDLDRAVAAPGLGRDSGTGRPVVSPACGCQDRTCGR